MRENILKCLYAAQNKSIVKQYVRSITTMARFDFPEKWPNLLQEVINYLSNLNDDRGVITGLYALFGLCKKFEYELEESREPLY